MVAVAFPLSPVSGHDVSKRGAIIGSPPPRNSGEQKRQNANEERRRLEVFDFDPARGARLRDGDVVRPLGEGPLLPRRRGGPGISRSDGVGVQDMDAGAERGRSGGSGLWRSSCRRRASPRAAHGARHRQVAGKDTRARHDDFVSAIGHRILEVENNLKESNVAEGRDPLSWIHLNEDERDDLAAFLSASPLQPASPLQQRDRVVSIPSAGDIEVGSNATRVKKDMSVESSKDSSGSTDLGSRRVKEDMLLGHRRAASASAGIGSWSMLIPNEYEGVVEQSSDGPHKVPLVKIVKSSALTSALQSKPRIKCKNGAVRWAGVDEQDVEEAIPLRSSQLNQGLDGCFERNKSCLSTCDEATYNKKLYGYLGALHRRLQRSQYQIRYGCPVQLIVLALAALVIFVCILRTIW